MTSRPPAMTARWRRAGSTARAMRCQRRCCRRTSPLTASSSGSPRPRPAGPTRSWRRARPSIFRRAGTTACTCWLPRRTVTRRPASWWAPSFLVGAQRVGLNVEDWGGFIGQWDDRRWVAKDISIPGQPSKTEHDDYAEMTGIRPGYIKRADLAWYCSHQHNGAGENVPYAYSYLFAYPIELPAGAKT